jgi:hypothetical protein
MNIRQLKPETLKLIFAIVVTFAASFSIGIIIGHFSGKTERVVSNDYYNSLIEEASDNDASLKNIMNLINSDSMRNNLKYYSMFNLTLYSLIDIKLMLK